MGKLARQERAHHNKGNTTVERNTIIDDNLLPPAEELARLQEIDPDAIQWIKERVKQEQDARIRFNDNRVELSKYDMTITRNQNMLALIFAFLIIVLGLVFSTYLIYSKLEIQGTIFAGATIVMAATMFLRHGKNQPTKK